MKKSFIALSVLTLCLGLTAGELENVRKLVGKKVIKCSPNGENGGMVPLKALSALKRGSTLMLLPGEYESEIVITPDRVIITSDQTGKCDVSIQLKGKDCILKNIWLHSVNADGNTVVVDSIVDRFYSGYQARRKLSHSLYNSGIGTIRCGYRDTKLKLKNCTVVSNYSALDCEQFSRWNIEKCILFSNDTVFEFDGYGNKKCKLSLRDNIIFGKTSIGKKDYTNSRAELAQALKLKDLKKMGSVTLLGKNLIEQPIFVKKLDSTAVPVRAVGDGRISFISIYDNLQPNNFRLKPESPGQDRGIIIAKNHLFKQKAPAPKKPKPKKELTPEEKKQQANLDKGDDIAKKAKEKKDKQDPPPKKKEDELGFGGIPEQPE